MKTKTFTMITGASSGLGRELAIQCASRGRNILLFALPGSNTNSFAEHLMQEYNVEAAAFEFDLTDTNNLKQNLHSILENYSVDFLINNAGVGGTSPIIETSLDAIDQIVMLNVRSTVLITSTLLPHLLKHSNSHILNISSMAAFTPIAYKTVYPASKAFISFFSLGLREEMLERGLSVSVLYPGPIMTNSSTSHRIIIQGLKGRMGLLSTPKLAKIAIDRTLAGDAVIIPGMMNKINHALMKIIPMELKLKLVSREVRKEIVQQQLVA